jgi:hypothetical protein
MDWSWLTPQLATALGAAIAATGALLGVLVKGMLDTRVATRQIEVQRELAIRQIETQREIAADQRAEDRNLALLDYRRAKYEELIVAAQSVLELGIAVRPGTAGTEWDTQDPEAQAHLLGAYKAQASAFRARARSLALVAPTRISRHAAEALNALPSLTMPSLLSFGPASTNRSNFAAAITKLMAACIEDINGAGSGNATRTPEKLESQYPGTRLGQASRFVRMRARGARSRS